MAKERTEHDDMGTVAIRKKETDHVLELLKKEDGVSTVVLVGDAGTGKTWMAREITKRAIQENLCYETLWLSLTDEYKTIPKDKTFTKAKSMPEEKFNTIMDDEESAQTIKKTYSMPEHKSETLLEESENETSTTEANSIPKHITEPMPEMSEIETVPEEEPKTEEINLKAETGNNLEDSEDSKNENTHGEESATEKKKTRIHRLLEDAIASKMLSQSSIVEEWEAETTVKKDEKTLTIDEMVREKLDEKKAEKKKYDLLLVLDQTSLPLGESRTNGIELWKEVFKKFTEVLRSIPSDRLITLVTSRKVQETAANAQPSKTEFEFEVGLLSSAESLEFLKSCLQDEVSNSHGREVGPLSRDEPMEILKECVQNVVSGPQHLDLLLKEIAEKSNGLPAAIAMIAKAIARPVSEGLTVKSASEKAADYKIAVKSALEKAAEYKIAVECVNPLVHCAYEMLPKDVLKFCICHSLQFFSKYGGIHYGELITQWILEGYFDSFHHIKQKYQEGHAVLMELINRGMLKIQEENIIVAEGAALKMIDCLPGLLGKSSLGLAGVSETNNQRIGLGRITQIDGMIKTVCDPKEWEKVTTLLIDGDRLRLEVDEEFLVRMKELEALAIFNSGLPSLVLSASESEKQSSPSSAPPEPQNKSNPEEKSPPVSENSEPIKKLPMKLLVLRSCELLNDINHVEQLKALTVLEISGARSLKELPVRLFDELIQLQSLNLSGCQMDSLLSLSKLTELRFLILRECSSLKKLPRIKELKHLEIIDLSGAASLTFFPEQDLSEHKKLHMIDLSRTPIKRLPKFGDLQELSRITIKGCKQVFIIPSFQKLGGLKILHISRVDFRNFHEIPPKNQLPLFPATLSELHVRDCPTLKFLPPIAHLASLEVLNVSGASDAEFAISDEAWGVSGLASSSSEESSHKMEYLREINLSNTKIRKLPSLYYLNKLRKVFLKNCSLLEKLPKMEGLENLQELHLSGCSELDEILDLTKFPKLEHLDISNTRIKVTGEREASTSLKIIRNESEAESQAEEKTPSILVNDAEIFQSLKENPELKEECIKQMSMPLCPPYDQAHLHGTKEVMFSDFYLMARSLQPYIMGSKFLEIRGLERFFAGLKDVFKNVEFISLVEHMSMKSLADLDAECFAKMKGCWIARCLEMESIFTEKTDAELVQKLEILGVSNLPKVKMLFTKTVNLMNLTQLHLDCCPKIKYVFSSSSQIPGNLQVLKIKFCDSLETVYNKIIEDGPEECTLSNLKTLLLFDLPNLTSIGFKTPNPLVWECPNLKIPPTSPIAIQNGH